MATGQPGPEGWSVFIPTGPAPNYKDFMSTDEFYKQDIDWINANEAKAKTRLEEDWGFDQRAYDLNLAQAQASGSGGDYGVAAATAAAALAKEKAAHDNANRAEYLREWLGSRGMIDSGQNAWEQNERTYQFDMYNKGIDQDLAARIQSANESRAQAQAQLSLRLQELSLGHDRAVLEHNRDVEDLPGSFAHDRGTAAFSLWSRLNENGQLKAPGINAAWDEESQLYVTADGTYYKVVNGVPVKTSYTRQTTSGGDSGGDSGGSSGSTQYAPWSLDPYESRPSQNVPSGGWEYM